MDKIRKDRITIYNSLNLTPKQLKCAEEMEKERYEQIEPLIGTLCIQKKELQELRLLDRKRSNQIVEILLRKRVEAVNLKPGPPPLVHKKKKTSVIKHF